MATKIKDTPVLTGIDSERFRELLEANRCKKVPTDEFERAMETYKMVHNMSDPTGV